MICKGCRRNIGKTTAENTVQVETVDNRFGRKGKTYTKIIRVCPTCQYKNIVKNKKGEW
jgi:hypothetical protein